jgi:hypothetical protein
MAAPTRDKLLAGRMTARLESKITEGLDQEIEKMARELAAGGDPTMFRSRAVRELLVAGVLARGEAHPKRRRITPKG